MMSKTFDCAECGASAPYGRLSCPSCGALLASVTGALKPALRAADVEAQPDRRSESVPIAATGSVAVAEAPGTTTMARRADGLPRSPRSPIHRLPRRQAPPLHRRGAGSDSCGHRSRQCAQACPDRFGRWRAEPDADPSRCSAGDGERRDTLRAGPSGLPSTDGTGIAPGSHADRRPKPGRTAHTPLRADAGGGRPSARCGRRRRAERDRRASPPPRRSSSRPRPPPSGRPPSRHRADPAPTAKAPTPAPAAQSRSAAQRAAIVPLLEPSAIAALPATPWAPLVEPAPALVGRPYQRHLASEAVPMTAGRPPSAYRPPSPAMAMAMGATAAWTNDGERPDPSSEDAAADAGPGQGPLPLARERPRARALRRDRRLVRGRRCHDGAPRVPAAVVARRHRREHDRRLLRRLGSCQPDPPARLRQPPRGPRARPSTRTALRRGSASGILGLVFGGLLLGLAWPYLVGPLGADVGLTMTALGAVALLIGGVVTLWATRHVVVEPVV